MPRTLAPIEPASASDLRSAFETRFGALVHRLAETAQPETLAEALASPDEISGLARALGRSVDLGRQRDPLAAARSRGTVARARLIDRAGGLLRVGEVAKMLGVSDQAVQARRTRGTIFALQQPNGEHVYPAFQIMEQGVLPGLADVLAAFHEVDPWTRLSVLLAPSARFDGLSAVDLLLRGKREDAVRIAATYGEHLG